MRINYDQIKIVPGSVEEHQPTLVRFGNMVLNSAFFATVQKSQKLDLADEAYNATWLINRSRVAKIRPGEMSKIRETRDKIPAITQEAVEIKEWKI